MAYVPLHCPHAGIFFSNNLHSSVNRGEGPEEWGGVGTQKKEKGYFLELNYMVSYNSGFQILKPFMFYGSKDYVYFELL